MQGLAGAYQSGSLAVRSHRVRRSSFAQSPNRLVDGRAESARIDPNNLEVWCSTQSVQRLNYPSGQETFLAAFQGMNFRAYGFLVHHRVLHADDDENVQVYHWASEATRKSCCYEV